MTEPGPIESLAAKIRDRHGHEVTVASQSGTLFVEFSKWPEATTTIQESDASEGRFAISYPQRKSTRSGRDRPAVQDAFAEGALESAVLWIIKKIAKAGHVPPDL